MSTIRKARGRVRATASRWWFIMAMVTGRVFSKPRQTLPMLSPTRIMSTPAASAILAVAAS